MRYIAAHFYDLHPEHEVFMDEMKPEFLDLVKETHRTLKTKATTGGKEDGSKKSAVQRDA